MAEALLAEGKKEVVLSPPRDAQRYLRKSPQAQDAFGYLSARQKLYKSHKKKNTITGNWGIAALSVEQMLKESPSKNLRIEDLDEQELFEQLNEMPGVFKTSLPKSIDKGKFGAWESPSNSPSPSGLRHGTLD